MANNTGFLLMAGLGALLFLGRNGATKTTDEDNRLLTGQQRGVAGPMPPAFNLQSYIDGLFGDMGGFFDEMATVPVQPPMGLFFAPNVVVTSSGVPGTSSVAPELITPTTKVVIGGDGGETITASALAVRRSEQIAQQEFEYAANVFAPPPGETEQANRIEEERQRQFARDLIAKNIADQLARNQAVEARTRLQQENIKKGLNPDGSTKALPTTMSVIGFDYSAGPPVIAIDESTGQWTYSSQSESESGRDIVVTASTEVIDVDFSTGFDESYVISGGMDSPEVEREAAYAIGF